jgi:hypothetical protein
MPRQELMHHDPVGEAAHPKPKSTPETAVNALGETPTQITAKRWRLTALQFGPQEILSSGGSYG